MTLPIHIPKDITINMEVAGSSILFPYSRYYFKAVIIAGEYVHIDDVSLHAALTRDRHFEKYNPERTLSYTTIGQLPEWLKIKLREKLWVLRALRREEKESEFPTTSDSV